MSSESFQKEFEALTNSKEKAFKAMDEYLGYSKLRKRTERYLRGEIGSCSESDSEDSEDDCRDNGYSNNKNSQRGGRKSSTSRSESGKAGRATPLSVGVNAHLCYECLTYTSCP